MSSVIRRIATSVRRTLKKAPPVQSWETYRRFRVERALLNNKAVATTEQTSVIHYSVNKAATQYTKRIMLRCGAENGLIPVCMSDYAWVKDFPYLFTLSADEVRRYLHIFRPHGFLYTVFGGLVEGIPDVDRYRTVIMIRDPRDVLVSGFYSYGKSHATPKDRKKAGEFEAFREKVSRQSVDDFVLDMSENTRWRMQQYLDLQRSSESVCILRYEDMLADFQTWLNRLLEHCQWEISAATRQELLSSANEGQRISGENTTSHRRQVVPGDHRRKLQGETIERLNEQFAEILTAFDYSQSVTAP